MDSHERKEKSLLLWMPTSNTLQSDCQRSLLPCLQAKPTLSSAHGARQAGPSQKNGAFSDECSRELPRCLPCLWRDQSVMPCLAFLLCVARPTKPPVALIRLDIKSALNCSARS